jgi:hypothetical protein
LSLGILLKITEVAQIFGQLFPWLWLCINFDKNGLGDFLGNFWAIFSPTHVVTLSGRGPYISASVL